MHSIQTSSPHFPHLSLIVCPMSMQCTDKSVYVILCPCSNPFISAHLFFSDLNSQLFIQFKLYKLCSVTVDDFPVPAFDRHLSDMIVRLDSWHYPAHFPVVSFSCIIDDDHKIVFLEIFPRFSPFWPRMQKREIIPSERPPEGVDAWLSPFPWSPHRWSVVDSRSSHFWLVF